MVLRFSKYYNVAATIGRFSVSAQGQYIFFFYFQAHIKSNELSVIS